MAGPWVGSKEDFRRGRNRVLERYGHSPGTEELSETLQTGFPISSGFLRRPISGIMSVGARQRPTSASAAEQFPALGKSCAQSDEAEK